MTSQGAQEVKAFILTSLRQPLLASGLDAASIPDDLDLRARGVIDSFGFIQLIGALEAQFGRIDLAALAPEQLTTIGVLCRHVADQVVKDPAPVERRR